jgi:integrase/recombinase XerD
MRESGRVVTAAAFQGLAAVPAEAEWFANLGNNATRRAYQNVLQDFIRFVGISRSEKFRAVTRVHVLVA